MLHKEQSLAEHIVVVAAAVATRILVRHTSPLLLLLLTLEAMQGTRLDLAHQLSQGCSTEPPGLASLRAPDQRGCDSTVLHTQLLLEGCSCHIDLQGQLGQGDF